MFERHYVKPSSIESPKQITRLCRLSLGLVKQARAQCSVKLWRKIDTEQFFISADDAIVPSEEWLQIEWQQARKCYAVGVAPVVLVVDEIQKVPHWSLVVKSLYDADRRNDMPVRVVLSGSSSLLLHRDWKIPSWGALSLFILRIGLFGMLPGVRFLV